MNVLHAFADESARRGVYVICAASVPAANLQTTRKVLRSLRAPRQGRIHFVNESDGRRRKILTQLAGLDLTSTIYVAQSQDQVAARTAILEAMVPDLRDDGVRRLILDSRDSQDARDRGTIYRTVGSQPEPEFFYDHQHSANEPLLWIPDAAAWAWGRGGRWKRQVTESGLVARVETVYVP